MPTYRSPMFPGCDHTATLTDCADCGARRWGNGTVCWSCHDRRAHPPTPRATANRYGRAD